MKEARLPLLAFVAGLIVFGVTAGGRLRRQSSDPHFVAQAAAWLEGRTDLATWPAGADDPAKVEEVELDDGRVVRGRRITTRKTFRVLGGEEIPQARIKQTVRTIHYVSFPALPSVLMIPQVLVHGARANDVGTTVFLAALVPAAFLLLLRRLRQLGLSSRTETDDIWLTALLCVGSVFYFSAVQGRVWYTAHVLGVLLGTLYLLGSLGAARPFLAGVCLGLSVVTRTPMAFLFPFFLWEAWRAGRTGLVRRVALFAAPVVVIGLVAAWYNHHRFGEWLEFGHSYLAIRQQGQIERHGLFSPHYLGRNLAVAFTLLPELLGQRPWVRISGHGLALWFTTPALLLLLWPRVKGPLHRSLWISVAFVAAWSLLYHNSGWVQFGYRFALDYLVLLVVLIAVGGRPLDRWAKALIILGIAVNLFGAVTFHRMPQHYRQDSANYGCVVDH